MAENQDDTSLNSELARLKQEIKARLTEGTIPPEAARQLGEVLGSEIEAMMKKRDEEQGAGNEDLAKVWDKKIDERSQYAADELAKPENGGEGGGGGGGEPPQGTSEPSDEDKKKKEQADEARKRLEEEQKRLKQQKGNKTPESKGEPGKAGKKPGELEGKPGKPTAGEAPKPTVPKPPVSAGGAVGAGAAEAGAGAGAAEAAGGKQVLMLLMKSPYFWLVVAIILVIIVIVMWFFGRAHKSFNEAGGSIPIAMNFNDKDDLILADQVAALRNSGMLVFAPGTEGDFEWRGDTMNLDWRIMETLKYLGEKWQTRSNGIIKVSLSYSNGPALTRRKGVLKTFGVVVGGNGGEPIDAPSAYLTGQAIGISEIGRISNGLADACFGDHDGDPSNNAPVEVSWQETASQAVIRPTYEQLQVDGTLVYQASKVLAGLAKQADGDAGYKQKLDDLLQSGNPDAWYTKAGNALDYMLTNLAKIQNLQTKGIDPRTRDYAGQASVALMAVRGATQSDILGWEKVDVQKQIEIGLNATFRMMQVANMVGWNGSKLNSCRLWKAYEARQNIRQLVLDMEQMPADPALVAANENWNSDLMARQVIVYSPEDDLDNGWPEYDVFPKGAVAVDEGGVGFDDTGKDGKIDEADSQFMDLPVDGGVFSKASTIFVYTAKGAWDLFQRVSSEVSLDVAIGGATQVLDSMHDLFSGTGISSFSGETLKKVTYKDFVHIGF